MKKFLITIIILFSISTFCIGQNKLETNQQSKMQWFADAKLGIFIHWGIYAVDGVSESWSFFNNYLSHSNYMKQLAGFNAANYDPNLWVSLIEESGAKYTVITAKHHDGIALWDSKQNNATTTAKHSAAKKDVLSPFIEAVKKSKLKTGLYFSLPDWSYNNYDVFTKTRKRYLLKNEPKRWNLFTNYFQGQLSELSKKYKPDLIWFDGDWEHNDKEWQSDKVVNLLKASNPNIIINSRLNGKGDYATPEQGVPIVAPASPFWELCYTMNDSWGYQPSDTKYKSTNMIIRTLVDCMANGGNLLLDIGPKADGTIPDEQINILKGLGRWTKKHAKAIYNTRAGIADGHFYGKTTLSKDKKTIFLYVDAVQEKLYFSGLKSKINDIQVIGMPQFNVIYKKDQLNNLAIQIPKNAFDKDVTVIAIALEEPIELAEIKPTPTPLNKIAKGDNLLNASKYLQIANQLQEGYPLFKSTNLSEDGQNFKPDFKNDPTLIEWIKKHAEACYNVQKGLPTGHFIGPTALAEDKKTIYLFVEGKPTGPIALKGIKNEIARVRVVGNGRIINTETYNKLYWSNVPGINYISIPEECLDKNLTVIAVLLKDELNLYREEVGAIESN